MRIPPLARRALLPTLRSTARFRVRFRDGLDALTGQVATHTRASTSTALDARGDTITVGYGRPRREARTWDGETVVGLRLSTDDLTYPCDWAPETGTLAITFVELGTRTTANAGLVYLGNDAVSGARLVVDATGTNYRATIHNGTSGQSATLSTATPATNAPAILLVQLEDTGGTQRVRVGLRLVGGATTWTAWSSTVTRAASWGTGAKIRCNRTGSSGTQGAVWLREIAWEPGLWDHDEMEERL